MKSILFENVDILLRDNDRYKTIRGYLGVENDFIDYIGETKPKKNYTEIKNYSGKLLMPGLINCHTHTPMVFLRGIGDGYNLQDWLNNIIFPIEGKMNEDIVLKASRYATLEMIAGGTTSFTDMYFFPEQTVQAAVEMGMKANVCKYLLSFDPNQKIEDSMIETSIDFIRKYNNIENGRIHADYGIHAEYTNQTHIVREYARYAKENPLNNHIHLCETKKECEDCIARHGVTPAKWFELNGTFDTPVMAAHCTWCTNEDLQILKKHNVSAVHNPTSNMKLGSGFAPLRKMLKLGINVALGTDGAASNNNLNMFEEMHIASIVHEGFNLDPTYLKEDVIIDMATINGAKAQQRFDTGILQVGKKADIIALDMSAIHLFPVFSIASILTSSVQSSDVCMSMVDGRILYENGRFLSVDKDKIVCEFKEAVETFFNSHNSER